MNEPKLCVSCGAECDWKSDECQGEVTVIDESTWENEDGSLDFAWVHACEYHKEKY